MFFSLVRNEEDFKIRDKLVFKPTLTHQVFREDETIHGYQNLKIHIHFHASSLQPFVEITYDVKEPNADDLTKKLHELFEVGFITTKEDFMKLLKSQEPPFKPFGVKLVEYERKDL